MTFEKIVHLWLTRGEKSYRSSQNHWTRFHFSSFRTIHPRITNFIFRVDACTSRRPREYILPDTSITSSRLGGLILITVSHPREKDKTNSKYCNVSRGSRQEKLECEILLQRQQRRRRDKIAQILSSIHAVWSVEVFLFLGTFATGLCEFIQNSFASRNLNLKTNGNHLLVGLEKSKIAEWVGKRIRERKITVKKWNRSVL